MAHSDRKTRTYLEGLAQRARMQSADFGSDGGYDAAKESPRRKAPTSRLISEDEQQRDIDRRRLIGGTRELVRNFAVAAWAIRKHLDFVSSFTFQPITKDKGFAKAFSQWIAQRSQRENCDRARRHPLRRMVRMAEARRTLDGDLGLVKLRTREVQAIEGDRFRDPLSGVFVRDGRRQWRHGVKTDEAGAALEYSVHRRKQGGGFQHERNLSADRLFWFACYDGHYRFDATRGTSPVVSALNDLRDLYEAKDYARAKMKVAQLFGLVIYSEAAESVGVHEKYEDVDTDGDGEADAEKYEVDFGKGPIKLHLDPGDRAEFLDNKTGQTDFAAFAQLCIAVALKSLDLPLSMWDEAYTNYFGSKSAITLYLRSAKNKRQDVYELLTAWTDWQLRMVQLPEHRDEFDLPSGMDWSDVIATGYDWIPDGMPWLDQAREIRGDIMAVAAGFTSRSRVVRERYGIGFNDILDELEQEEAEIEARGINISEAPPEAFAPETVSSDDNKEVGGK